MRNHFEINIHCYLESLFHCPRKYFNITLFWIFSMIKVISLFFQFNKFLKYASKYCENFKSYGLDIFLVWKSYGCWKIHGFISCFELSASSSFFSLFSRFQSAFQISCITNRCVVFTFYKIFRGLRKKYLATHFLN